MNVNKVENGGLVSQASQRCTTEDLENEYNYILASRILENMLEKELITVNEWNKIMRLNRQSFTPLLAQIMP